MVIITERSFYFNRKCLRTFRRFCYGILGAVYQILVSCGVHQSPDTLAVSVRYPLICSRNASRSWCWPGAAAGFRQLWKWQQRKHGTPSADRGNKTAVMGMCVLFGKLEKSASYPLLLILRKYKQFGNRSEEISVWKNTQATHKPFPIIGSYISCFR